MILLVGFLTLSGLALVQQVQNLVEVVIDFINDFPNLVADLSTQVYTIGPLTINLAQYDLATLSERILTNLQPIFGRLGGLVGSFATSAATTIWWIFFVLLISYFLLSDASQVPEELLYIEIPGYDADIRRLGRELRRIWNSYLRGQLIVIGLVMITYTILFTALGVRYSLAIAILAGLARLVPYLGPFVSWTVLMLVTFFQRDNYFGLEAVQYTLLVLMIAIVVDQIFDQLISPRLLGDRLGVHPAAVLIGAIVATSLIGIVGLVLVAPVLASLKLLGGYALRKVLDLDPWQPLEEENRKRTEIHETHPFRRLRAWIRAIRQRG